MKRLWPSLVLAAVLFTAVTSPLLAQTFPQPQGYVSDFAGLLSTSGKNRLETQLALIEKETGTEVAVVTVKSLDGVSIEDYASRLFEKWGIGKKDKDNGVLFLTASDDRKVRIEVGYGLEAIITDARAGRILDNEVLPAYRRGDYEAGITAGVNAIESYVRSGMPPGSEEETAGTLSVFEEVGFMGLFFLGFVFLSYLFSYMSRTKSIWLGGLVGALAGVGLGAFIGSWVAFAIAPIVLGGAGTGLDWILSRNYQARRASGRPTTWRRSWGGFSGGGRSGGFGGFGGGMSGGGGASRRW